MCEHYCPECGKKFSVEPSPSIQPSTWPVPPFEPFIVPFIPWWQPPFYVGDVIPPQVVVTCRSTINTMG